MSGRRREIILSFRLPEKEKIPFLFTTDTLLLGRRLAARHDLPFYCAEDRSCYEAEQLTRFISIFLNLPPGYNPDN